MRWRLRLAEYTFAIFHKKGLMNRQADAVSRLDTDGHSEVERDTDIPTYSLYTISSEPALLEQISVEELLREQSDDKFCQGISEQLNAGSAMNFRNNPENGVLERVLPSHTAAVIHRSLQPRLIAMEHRPVCAGHEGGRRMYTSMRRYYYWPRMSLDCYEAVAVCEECAKSRTNLQKSASELQLFPAEKPLEEVAMDMLGPLLRTPRGNINLLVIVDRFTKLVRTVPMGRVTAAEVAKAFVNHWVFVYGPPKSVLTDKGGSFRAKFMLEAHRQPGIESNSTTTYHPKTYGQAERFNRTLLAGLRKYIGDHPTDWDLYTGALTFAYNTHVHTATGFSPFELVLSRPPASLAMEKESERGSRTPKETRAAWLKRLGETIETVRSRLETAQRRTKRNFDERLRRRRKKFRVGDMVVVKLDKESRPAGQAHKLAPKTEGPFRVTFVRTKTVIIRRGDSREEGSTDRVELTSPSHDETSDEGTETRPGEPEYVIDRIVAHRVRPDGQMEFQLRWTGYDEQTW